MKFEFFKAIIFMGLGMGVMHLIHTNQTPQEVLNIDLNSDMAKQLKNKIEKTYKEQLKNGKLLDKKNLALLERSFDAVKSKIQTTPDLIKNESDKTIKYSIESRFVDPRKVDVSRQDNNLIISGYTEFSKKTENGSRDYKNPFKIEETLPDSLSNKAFRLEKNFEKSKLDIIFDL